MTTDLRRRNISGAAIDDIAVHEGLRSYMLQVYNYMSSGLLLSGIVAMLVANTSLGAMFYQFNEAGRIAGYTNNREDKTKPQQIRQTKTLQSERSSHRAAHTSQNELLF